MKWLQGIMGCLRIRGYTGHAVIDSIRHCPGTHSLAHSFWLGFEVKILCSLQDAYMFILLKANQTCTELETSEWVFGLILLRTFVDDRFIHSRINKHHDYVLNQIKHNILSRLLLSLAPALSNCHTLFSFQSGYLTICPLQRSKAYNVALRPNPSRVL